MPSFIDVMEVEHDPLAEDGEHLGTNPSPDPAPEPDPVLAPGAAASPTPTEQPRASSTVRLPPAFTATAPPVADVDPVPDADPTPAPPADGPVPLVDPAQPAETPGPTPTLDADPPQASPAPLPGFSTAAGASTPTAPPHRDVSASPDTASADPGVLAAEMPNSFYWTVPSGSQSIALTATLEGDYLVSSGQIAPIEVTDTRPEGPAFAISGQISDFTPALPGRYVGWQPLVLTEGAGVVAGTAVSPGLGTGGHGLRVPALLGAADSGHPPGTASLGAQLQLQLPRQTPAGTYTTTLTITALS